MRKPFDRVLYAEDDNAKQQILDWLSLNEFWAWVNPDQFGIDVLAYKHDVDYGFEVEVKHNWKGARFPYDEVHFAERKRKFIGPNTFFTMLNDDRSHVLVVPGETLGVCRVVSKKTKYTDSELFFEVPLSACVVYLLDGESFGRDC